MNRLALMLPIILVGCSTAATISADIATACADALPAVNDLAPIASLDKTGAVVVASLRNACTANGMVQMTINDQAPVTPTNSGASAVWVAQSRAFVQAIAAKLKPAK